MRTPLPQKVANFAEQSPETRIDKTSKPIDVAPHAGAVTKKTIEPTEMTRKNLNKKPDVDHGKKSSDADNVPKPGSPEKIT